MTIETIYARQNYEELVELMAGEDRSQWPLNDVINEVLDGAKKGVNDLVEEVREAIQQAHRDYAEAVEYLAHNVTSVLLAEELQPILARAQYTYGEFKEHLATATETAQLQAQVAELQSALDASEETVKELSAQLEVDSEQRVADELARLEMQRHRESCGLPA